MRWLLLVLLATPAYADDGARLLEAGRLDEAEAHFTQELANGDRGWTHFDLCLVHYARGAFSKAIDECYRALARDRMTDERVQLLLTVIRAEIDSQHLELKGTLPHPTAAWFDPEKQLALRIEGSNEKATRIAAAFEPQGAALAELHGAALVLPYRVAADASDYTRGFDVKLVSGALFYARDTTPFVAGVRGERRARSLGSTAFRRDWIEYLHAVDGTGGMLAAGTGVAGGGTHGEHGFGFDGGFSIPFGKDTRRDEAAFAEVQTALMLEARFSLHQEIALGGTKLGLHASIAGGVNVGKGLQSFGRAFEDLGKCKDEQDTSCDKRDPAPDWKWTYWMLQVGVSIGTRGGVPRYHRAHVFAPSGAR